MASGPPRHPAILREQAVFVRDGRVVHEGGPREGGEWVYAWTRPHGRPRILYVGATALPLAERAALHLESPVPTIGRIRAEQPDALRGELVVRGFQLVPGTDRQAVRRALAMLLMVESGSVAELQGAGESVRALAEAIAARIET